MNIDPILKKLDDLGGMVDSGHFQAIELIKWELGKKLSLLEEISSAKSKQFLESKIRYMLQQEIESSVLLSKSPLYNLKNIYWENSEFVEISLWSDLFSCLESIPGILEIFRAQGNLVITTSQSTMTIKFTPNVEKIDLDPGRIRMYQLIKKLLNEQIIVTYKIQDAQMIIHFSFYQASDRYLAITYDESRNPLTLLFNDYWLNYQINSESFDQVMCSTNSVVFEYDSSFKFRSYESESYLKKIKALSIHSRKNIENVTILHFSFPFRPLSIIIPSRGVMLSRLMLNDKAILAKFGTLLEVDFCHLMKS